MESSNASTCVRKHPAPEGALRPYLRIREVNLVFVRKHPAPEGALRRGMLFRMYSESSGPKAPSTRRCIKTEGQPSVPGRPGVRKHPAPEGALRQESVPVLAHKVEGPKAPSTRRCIKTPRRRAPGVPACFGQKAPSTRRCIKTIAIAAPATVDRASESTQHQKVH